MANSTTHAIAGHKGYNCTKYVITAFNTKYVITATSDARNRVVFFDSHLDLKQHISNVCRACYLQLRQLRVVRRSLQLGVVGTILPSFVSCRLDYCNSLMTELPLGDLQQLQSFQNAAARIRRRV